MKIFKLTFLSIITLLYFNSCSDDDSGDINSNPIESHDFLVITNITSTSNVTSYIGTFKDLTVGSYTNQEAQQATSYPFVAVFGDNVFVAQNREGDQVIKYQRTNEGTLTEMGRMTMPADSQPMHVLVESDSRAFCSLYNTGGIAVFNPSTMTMIETIDVTSFAKGDGSPDPAVMMLNGDFLYVAVSQTTDTFTSSHPAEILRIDLSDNNSIISITDDRASYAGNVDTPESLFIDELGDVYVYCVSSYGFGSGQKAGFLRIKNGESEFDESYFFNTTDLNIDGIAGNHIDYLHKPDYAGNGIIYSTGNVYALASNPPDYINDRTFGNFKVDIYNQTIEVLDIPFSNGYSACSLVTDDRVLFGVSGIDGVGVYVYDPITDEGSNDPIVTTQGDPSTILKF